MTCKTSYLGSIDRGQLFIATSMFETDKITVHTANYLNKYFDIVSVCLTLSWLKSINEQGSQQNLFLLASLLVNLDEFLKTPIKAKAIKFLLKG